MSYLTIPQAAEKLQVPPGTVKSMIKAGRLKAVRLNATNIRIKEEDLETIQSAPAPKKRANSGEHHWSKQKAAAQAVVKPAKAKKETAQNGKAEKEPAGVI